MAAELQIKTAGCCLYAMRAVNELGIPMKKNVRLILGTD